MKKLFKKYMIAGMLVLVPVAVTIWVLKTIILWLDGLLLSILPYQIQPEGLIGYNIPGIGLILTIIMILITGILTRLYVGKRLIHLGDAVFNRLPFGRAVYNATKQVLHTTLSELSETGQKTRRVVLVEYPKSGSYAIGFLTGSWTKPALATDEKEMVFVFIPTTPNPTSGFLLIVPKDSVIPTDLTAEEASKIVISGGLLAKVNQGGGGKCSF